MLTYLVFFVLFQTSGGTITGKLIDYNSRNPIDGAKIVLQKTAYKTRTDKNGEFTLSNVPPGTYHLDIVHPSYPSGGPKTITVKKDSTTRADYSMFRSRVPNMQYLEADTTKPTHQ